MPFLPSAPSPEEEPTELARFRAEWLAELRERRKFETSTSGKAVLKADGILPGPSEPPNTLDDSAGILPDYQDSSVQRNPSSYAAVAYVSKASVRDDGGNTLPPTFRNALDIYRRAVEHEQRSELDEALTLYRHAFRLNPNVDRAFHREEMLASILPIGTGSVPYAMTNSILAGVLASFPDGLTFHSEVEGEPVHLSKLPDELLVIILRKLDTTSLERFATIGRKARVITLDPAIWRDKVTSTYKPPQVRDIEAIVAIVKDYSADYRCLYIEHPRVRLDGVYIATCHYIRPGLSENSWVNVSHLITYHRYLRFLPNGQVLSLLANEEHTPQQIIPLLKPALRMKGFFIGTWYLSGTTIHLTNLLDASGRFPLEHDPLTIGTPESSEYTRYAFTMALELRSRPLGRWNKLHLEAYDSVNLNNGDITPVVLKHERPFWFSKVRSY